MLQDTAIDGANASLRVGKIIKSLFLLGGPMLSYLLLSSLTNESADLNGLVFALFVLWSPLFFGVPALLMQRERDGSFMNEKSTIVRGIKIIPHLLLSPDSTVRPETFASILGWFVFGFIAFEPLAKGSGAILKGLVSFAV